jgi:hypothetical protein
MLRARLTGFIIAVCLGFFSSGECQSPEEMMLQDAIRKYEREEYEAAHKQLNKLLSVLDEKNPVGHYYMALIYMTDGPLSNEDKARFHYFKAKGYDLKFDGKIEPISQFEEDPQQEGPSSEEMAQMGRDAAVQPAEVLPADESSIAESEDKGSETDGGVGIDSELTEDSSVGAKGGNPKMASSPEVEAPSVPSDTLSLAERFSYAISTEDDLSGEDAVDIEEMIRKMPDNEIGRILDKVDQDEPLTQGEERTLHVFRVGIELCLRRIEAGRLEEAGGFAEDVQYVAPALWHGYYLMARVHEANRDFVRASVENQQAQKYGYLPTQQFPPIIVFDEPMEQLRHFLSVGRKYMSRDEWIEAEDMLMLTQDVEDLPGTDDVYALFSEIDFRLGEIAFRLEDCETAVGYMEIAIEDGYPATARERLLLSEASDCAEFQIEVVVDQRPITYEPLQFVGVGGAYGGVHLDIRGRDFMDINSRTLLGRDSSRRLRPTEGERAHTYQVQGGGAYRLDFDMRNQLKKAVIHSGSALLIIGILLAF